MADLPVDRDSSDSVADHVADHNTLHATHNLIDGDGSDGDVLTRVGGSPAWAAQSGTSVVSEATVATSQSTTSGTYVDLATAGPALTRNVPASGKVKITLSSRINATHASPATAEGWMGVALSGGNTVVADQTNALSSAGPSNNQQSYVFVLSGLTPGSTTFTAKYRIDNASSATFANRRIIVEDA